jgi:SH3 domain-containing YSC84-like protein 1
MSASAPDKGVPKQVLEGAKCVAVIPKLVKGAFVIGGEHGTGVATCRTSTNSWSAPALFSVSVINLAGGPQIGGKSTDLLMFIMNDQGMNELISGHFKVGADACGLMPTLANLGPPVRSGGQDRRRQAGKQEF